MYNDNTLNTIAGNIFKDPSNNEKVKPINIIGEAKANKVINVNEINS